MMDRTERLEKALAAALERNDLRAVSELVDELRFGERYSWQKCYEVAKAATGMDEAEWDEVLYLCDQAEMEEER